MLHKSQIEPLGHHDLSALEAAKQLIEQDPTRHITIPELAKIVGLNDAKLKSGFQLLYGTGVFGHLTKVRMERAVHYLAETDLTSKEISPLVGYGYLTNFIAAFKKYHHKTPTEFRNQLEKNSKTNTANNSSIDKMRSAAAG